MEVTEHYPNPSDMQAYSDSSSRPRAPYWKQVEALRASGDWVMILSVPAGSNGTLRFTYANGQSILTDLASLRWFVKNEIETSEDDVRSALAFLFARKIFRSLGGKKRLGISFRDWMTSR
jgi:hypothetical protein